MRLNRRMQRDLADLRSRAIDVQTLLPGSLPRISIVEAGGCCLLREFAVRPHLRLEDFADRTGLECSANKLRMERMLDPRLVASCPLLLLTAGLFTVRAVCEALAELAGPFRVILSYDGESCAVRFHKVRAGQRWLSDDLDGYVDEGVLVVDAGKGLESPPLLG